VQYPDKAINGITQFITLIPQHKNQGAYCFVCIAHVQLETSALTELLISFILKK
jgi:hypothetical protein